MTLHEDLTRVIEDARDASRKHFNVVKESYGQYLARAILASDVIAAVRAEEREKAAQIADSNGMISRRNLEPYWEGWDDATERIANEIRAQGEGGAAWQAEREK